LSTVIGFSVEPGNLTVKQGDVFNVSVGVEDIPANPGISAAEFHLSWDPSVLNALSYIKIMFQDNSIGWDKLNDTEGLLTYVHAASASISGNQTLEIITLEAIGQGSTTLHFIKVAACSPDSATLNCEAFDGRVTVEGETGTVAPIASNMPTNVIYTMTIMGGSVVDKNTLILPPAIATENVPFSVNIEIANVTGIVSWEFGLCWNKAVLNCTNVEIYNPDGWKDEITIDGKIDNNFNSTYGRYHIAVAAGPDKPFSGNMTIATLTFNPIGTGTTPLTFNIVDMCDVNAFSLASTLSTTIGSITVDENTSP
jgi:hypothetical protein